MISALTSILLFAAAYHPTPLQAARDAQDRPALEKLTADAEAAAAKAPNDLDAQLRVALSAAFLAEVNQELRDNRAAQQAAARGIKAAEKAVALKPDSGEAYRLLGTLYGQA